MQADPERRKDVTEEKKLSTDVSRLTDFEALLLILERYVSQYRVERINELLNKTGEFGFVYPATCLLTSSLLYLTSYCRRTRSSRTNEF